MRNGQELLLDFSTHTRQISLLVLKPGADYPNWLKKDKIEDEVIRHTFDHRPGGKGVRFGLASVKIRERYPLELRVW